MTSYQFAIQNCKQYIRGEENLSLEVPWSVFDFAPVIAISFMKQQEDVLTDLIALGE